MIAKTALTHTHKRRILIITKGEQNENERPIKLLESNGWKFKRHGGNHDVYVKDGKINHQTE